MAAPFPAQRPATPDCCVMPRAVLTASVIVKLCDFDVMYISLTRSMGASTVFPTAPAAAPHASNSTDVSRSRIWGTDLWWAAALRSTRLRHDGLVGTTPCVRCGTGRHARVMSLRGVHPCPYRPEPLRKGAISPAASCAATYRLLVGALIAHDRTRNAIHQRARSPVTGGRYTRYTDIL